MSIAALPILPLETGDVLTAEEFLRRWEAMPALKRAELIREVVYMLLLNSNEFVFVP